MDVAVISVLTTAVVAVLTTGFTIGAQVYNGRAQRKHDAKQSHEDRVWDQKRETLLELIRLSLRLRSSFGDTTIAYFLDGDLPTLRDQIQPVVAAYGSQHLRDSLAELLEVLEEWHGDLDRIRLYSADHAREVKSRAIDNNDFEKAARYRDREREAVEAVMESLSHRDPDVLRLLAEEAIDLSRDDLGSGTA